MNLLLKQSIKVDKHLDRIQGILKTKVQPNQWRIKKKKYWIHSNKKSKLPEVVYEQKRGRVSKRRSHIERKSIHSRSSYPINQV